MRRIKKETLEKIIKRQQREKKRGRETKYEVDYLSYGYDPQSIAWLRTPNKVYCLYRSNQHKEEYRILRVDDKYKV